MTQSTTTQETGTRKWEFDRLPEGLPTFEHEERCKLISKLKDKLKEMAAEQLKLRKDGYRDDRNWNRSSITRLHHVYGILRGKPHIKEYEVTIFDFESIQNMISKR